MNYQIKHKSTGKVLFEGEYESMGLCVGAAVGESANLRYADLRGANLRYADLQGAYLRGADLQGANLRYANLRYANLWYADLQGAYLDFSCWPLWCGSKKVKVSIEFVYQLCAHIVVLECGSKVFPVIKKLLMPFAKKFKRWDELSNDN